MTRILVLQNMYPPHHYGGYEQSCRDVVERWRARGHDVTVLTSDHRVAGVDHRPVEAGVRRRLPLAVRDGVLDAPPRWRRAGREWTSRHELREAIAAARPEVISVWHMAGLSAGMLHAVVDTGLPIVYVVCDDWLSYLQPGDPWLRMFAGRPRLARLLSLVSGLPTTSLDLGRTGAFCFVSACTRERSKEYTGWTFPIETVTFSGIDTTDFPIAADEEPTPPWHGRLLYVGRLDVRKGVETAVRGVAALPDATLEMIGPGDDISRGRLAALVGELGIAARVTFVASLARAELRARYEAADAVLFPTEWDEPFGLVALEAMACGTPVIATGSGGSGEFLVDGDNCVLFPPGDANALAAAVRRVAGDSGLRRRIVAGGLRTAATFTADRLADVLETCHVGRLSQPA